MTEKEMKQVAKYVVKEECGLLLKCLPLLKGSASKGISESLQKILTEYREGEE